jgi:hypothetical protein
VTAREVQSPDSETCNFFLEEREWQNFLERLNVALTKENTPGSSFQNPMICRSGTAVIQQYLK